MNDILQILSAQIASTKKWKPRDGQAVKGSFPGRYRKVPKNWYDEECGRVITDDNEMLCYYLEMKGHELQVFSESLLEAISCGPDLTDETTMLSLLADMKYQELHSIGQERWTCATMSYYGSRAEAIARAWICEFGDAT